VKKGHGIISTGKTVARWSVPMPSVFLFGQGIFECVSASVSSNQSAFKLSKGSCQTSQTRQELVRALMPEEDVVQE